jgi:hypothetical protein
MTDQEKSTFRFDSISFTVPSKGSKTKTIINDVSGQVEVRSGERVDTSREATKTIRFLPTTTTPFAHRFA